MNEHNVRATCEIIGAIVLIGVTIGIATFTLTLLMMFLMTS